MTQPDPATKRTPLHAAHVRAGARMIPFGGWAGEAASSSEIVLETPVTTPMRRLDQTLAARQPDLRWTLREPAR